MKDGTFIVSLDWRIITEWANQLLVKQQQFYNNYIIST